jgi:predicted dinucleotide-binding enzyme
LANSQDKCPKKSAATLAADLGFDPLDAGPLTMARLLEPYAMRWISLAIKQGLGGNLAFHMMCR